MSEIMLILKFIFKIFGVAMEERQKAHAARQKYDLDESAMLHIAVIAVHRIRDSALTESAQAAQVEERVEASVEDRVEASAEERVEASVEEPVEPKE